MNDVTNYESFLLTYADFTEAERRQYWKKQNAIENITHINRLHNNISLNNSIIKQTKRWLQDLVDDYTERVEEPTEADTAELRGHLALGAELIQNCQADTGRTRAEIAHVTRYPLYSEKRRQWYKSKEGSQWLKNQPKKR